jgi:hypothetical protein
MHNVEPFRIETTRERLTDALEFAKSTFVQKPEIASLSEDEARAILDDIKILEIGIESHSEEMKAIYYTLRLRGIEEQDFGQNIADLRAEDIYIAVELSTANEDEIIAYTLSDNGEVEAEVEAPAA